jgi:hypothetical protein
LPDVESPRPSDASFVLVRDGTQVLADADGHARWVRWFDNARSTP